MVVRFAILLLIASPVSGQDWSHWRGPTRNGVVGDSSAWNGSSWPIGESWSANVGEGSTSPLVCKGRLFTMGWRDGRDRVVCLDAKTGTSLWSVDYACPQYGRLALGDQGIYSGPSATPEFDESTAYLYTLSTDGDLRCWDTRQSGKLVWGTNLYESFDVPRRPRVGRSGHRDYGYTSSPLVWRDWLIVEVGAKEGNLIAFDKRTGARRWTSQATSSAGHNGGPVLITVENVPCVAVHNHDGLLVTRLDTGHEGQTVATYDWVTSFANNIATATVHDNFVLLTSAYNQYRLAKIEVTLSGSRKVWEQELASKVCSPVVHKGFVYWAWGKVNCVDFETGKLQWQGGRVGDPGSLIATADDRLIVWTNRGDLLLIDSATRSPASYSELAAQAVLDQSDAWPHIVFAEHRLYCKDRDGNVRCLTLPASQGQ